MAGVTTNVYNKSQEPESRTPVIENATSVSATHTSGADTALNLLKETGGVHRHIDPETNRRLLRKIDFHIMPLICIVYFLQYIDKTAISYGSVTGLLESTHLHGTQFNVSS